MKAVAPFTDMKSFYVQVTDPRGGVTTDGYHVPINRRFLLPEMKKELAQWFGEDLANRLLKARSGDSGLEALPGWSWIVE